MSTDTEREDLVTELLEKAEIQGYLATDEILETIPEVEDSMDQLEDLFVLLQEAGIEILEG
jgi:hypothetical protein